MREGLRSGRKGSVSVSDKRVLVGGIVEIKVEKEFEIEENCCQNIDFEGNRSESSGKVGEEVHNGRRGRKRKNVEELLLPKELSLINKGDDVVEEFNGDVDGIVDSCNDVNKVGKGGRECEGKNVTSPSKGDFCVGEGIKKEGVSLLVSNCVATSAASVVEKDVKEENCKSEEFLKMVDANGRSECTQQLARCDRGKERRNFEGSEFNKNDIDLRKKVKEGTMQVNGRVLRSSICMGVKVDAEYYDKSPIIGALKQVDRHRGRPPKVQGLDWDWVEEKADTEKNEKRRDMGRQTQLQGHHGRLPRIQGRNRAPEVEVETVDMKKDVKPQLIDRSCRTKKEEVRRGRPPKVQTASNVEIGDTEGDEDARHIARPKRLRGHLDRSPKVLGVKRGLMVIQKDIIHKNKSPMVKKELEPLDVNVDKKQKVIEFEKTTSLREEKQMIREQIIDILIKAGWTTEYRPRQGREYHDAVYVDREGKTH